MRKPVSKHALRRAMERAGADGLVRWDEPTGTVIDRIWRELEREAFNRTKRRDGSRESIRTMEPEPEAAAAEA